MGMKKGRPDLLDTLLTYVLASRRAVAFWENVAVFFYCHRSLCFLPVLDTHFIPPLINFISPH